MNAWKKGILAAFLSPVLMGLGWLLAIIPPLEWLGMAITGPGTWAGLMLVGTGHGIAQVAGALFGAYVWCWVISYGIIHRITRRREQS